MSDWQAGDLALCVDTSRRGRWIASYVTEGRIYTVSRAYVDFDGEHVLTLDGVNYAYLSDRFRKIRPDEREACEPEFVTLLKRSKRKVTAIAAAARQSGDAKQAPSAGPQSGHEVASPNGGSHA